MASDNSDIDAIQAQLNPPPPPSFLRKYWIHGVYVVLMVAFFSTGLFLGRGQQKVVKELVEKEKIVYQDRLVEKIVEVAAKTRAEDKKERTHKVTTIIQVPDGGTTTTITEDSGTDTSTKEMEVRFVDRIMERIITEEKWLEKKVVVTVESKKSVVIISALGLVDLNQLLANPSVAFAGGLQIHFRLAGPLWGSVFGAVGPSGNPIPRGLAGITLGLEF